MADRDFDLLDGDWYVNDPYPDYAWLRANAPAYWDAGNELWGISRYDDIVEIEKRKDVFINSDQDKGGYRPNIPADPAIIGIVPGAALGALATYAFVGGSGGVALAPAGAAVGGALTALGIRRLGERTAGDPSRFDAPFRGIEAGRRGPVFGGQLFGRSAVIGRCD